MCVQGPLSHLDSASLWSDAEVDTSESRQVDFRWPGDLSVSTGCSKHAS